jgi:hypothetical protein
MDLTADAEFGAWLTGLADDPAIDFDPADPATDYQDWIAGVFRDGGALNAEWLNPRVFERRRNLAQAAVQELRTAAEGDMGPLRALEVVTREPSADEPAGAVQVGDETVRALSRAGVTAEAADGVQGFIARERGIAWPSCPVHGRGLHPAVRSGVAVWTCSDGDHVVSVIGAR